VTKRVKDLDCAADNLEDFILKKQLLVSRVPGRFGSGTFNDESDPDGQLFVSIRVSFVVSLYFL
jgi:hypothetical protein